MDTNIEPGEILEITIDSAAHGGDGVGRVSGMVCFVSGALPGDVVRAKIFRRGTRAAWADTVDVLSPSPDRDTSLACAGKPCMSACACALTIPPGRMEAADCFGQP